MKWFLVLEGCFALLCIIEALLERILIELKSLYFQLKSVVNMYATPLDQQYAHLNKKEHGWSAVYYICIVGMVSVAAWEKVGWMIIPMAIVERRIFFDYSLKIARNRKISAIEGDMPMDNFCRKIFGANGGWRELAFWIVILTITNYVASRINITYVITL